MSRAMGRWAVVGALALAAVPGGWTAVEARGQGGQPANPFEGRYTGLVPGALLDPPPGFWDDPDEWTVSIDSRGQVYSRDRDLLWNRTLSGKVSKRGLLSAEGHQSYLDGLGLPGYGNTFSLEATVALDAAGNLVGTTTSGESFVWYRE